MDVIALLFDYVFRDPSIPDSLRRLFGRLQVPIVKAALLDRDVLLRPQPPGAPAARPPRRGGRRRDRRRRVPRRVRRRGDARRRRRVPRLRNRRRRVRHGRSPRSRPFIDDRAARGRAGARRSTSPRRSPPRSARPTARRCARCVRDRLAGLELPFEVRAFAETVWADYLADVRKRQGAESDAWTRGAADARRPAVEHRRQGAHGAEGAAHEDDPDADRRLAQGLHDARAAAPTARRAFFETLYGCTWPRSSPHAEPRPVAVPRTGCRRRRTGNPRRSRRRRPRCRPATSTISSSEMVVGTWLAFDGGRRRVDGAPVVGEPAAVEVHLHQPLRTSAPFVFSPEELAWKLVNGQGRARRRAGAAVRSRGQRGARHAGRAQGAPGQIDGLWPPPDTR